MKWKSHLFYCINPNHIKLRHTGYVVANLPLSLIKTLSALTQMTPCFVTLNCSVTRKARRRLLKTHNPNTVFIHLQCDRCFAVVKTIYTRQDAPQKIFLIQTLAVEIREHIFSV